MQLNTIHWPSSPTGSLIYLDWRNFLGRLTEAFCAYCVKRKRFHLMLFTQSYGWPLSALPAFYSIFFPYIKGTSDRTKSVCALTSSPHLSGSECPRRKNPRPRYSLSLLICTGLPWILVVLHWAWNKPALLFLAAAIRNVPASQRLPN